MQLKIDNKWYLLASDRLLTKRLFLFVACISTVAAVAFAQSPSYNHRIYGVVVDAITHKPIPLATIEWIAGNNSIKRSIITQADGSFNFNDNSSKKVQVAITAVGFQPKIISINDSIHYSKNLGLIALTRIDTFLRDVVITASRPLVKQEADKIIYDLQADPDSKSNSVWEMMRKVPFLSVDGQDNILLKGSSSYRIFINGKPSGMVERNPKDVLQSIPASTILSIEVITTPSAKYDAEGLAGIINIITLKKIDNGYNGTLNLTYKLPIGGPGAGSYFSFKKGKLGMSVLAGGSLYRTPFTTSSSIRKTSNQISTNLYQNSDNRSTTNNGYLGSEISYEIDSLHLLSAQFNVSKSKGTGLGNQHTLLTESGNILQQYDINNDSKNGGTGLDLGLNYQLGFRRSKDRLLTFSYRYLTSKNQQSAVLDIFSFINYHHPDYQQANKGVSTEHTLQADYVQPIKKIMLEAGIKAIFRNNSSDFQYAVFDSTTNRFAIDALRSNTYQNYQYILSAYNTYQWAVKSWSVKAGLRLEETIVDADFISTASQVQQHYLSVIPAAVVSKKLNATTSLSVSYTNRIQRPGINQLNPFVDRSNLSFETSGNPSLKPAYTNVFQLSYVQSRKATLNIALGCMLFNNLVSRFFMYDSLTAITKTTFRNIGTTRIYKVNMYFNYPLSKSWNVRLNSDIRYINSHINTGKTILQNKGWAAYVNTSSSYRLDGSWRVNADLTINSASVSGIQSTTNGFTSLNTNVQKDIAKGKITLTFVVNNPFSKYRYSREELFGPDFTQTNITQLYFRAFGVSFNYRFGKLKEAVKKNKRIIKNDDAVE